MSSGMNMEEAKEYAKSMSYSQAVYNVIRARCVPYRKATKIKLKELLEVAKKLDKAEMEKTMTKCKGCIHLPVCTSREEKCQYYKSKADIYREFIEYVKFCDKTYMKPQIMRQPEYYKGYESAFKFFEQILAEIRERVKQDAHRELTD